MALMRHVPATGQGFGLVLHCATSQSPAGKAAGLFILSPGTVAFSQLVLQPGVGPPKPWGWAIPSGQPHLLHVLEAVGDAWMQRGRHRRRRWRPAPRRRPGASAIWKLAVMKCERAAVLALVHHRQRSSARRRRRGCCRIRDRWCRRPHRGTRLPKRSVWIRAEACSISPFGPDRGGLAVGLDPVGRHQRQSAGAESRPSGGARPAFRAADPRRSRARPMGSAAPPRRRSMSPACQLPCRLR